MLTSSGKPRWQAVVSQFESTASGWPTIRKSPYQSIDARFWGLIPTIALNRLSMSAFACWRHLTSQRPLSIVLDVFTELRLFII
jgi:hypothetical protein